MDLAATPVQPTRAALPRLGSACLASGLLGLIIGVLTLAWPHDVPRDQWSYPFSPGVGWAVSVVLCIAHVLTAAGFLGVLAADPHAGRRAATVALGVAVVGFAGLAICELLSGAIGSESTDSGTAGVVGGLFGLTSLSTAGGSIVAGLAVLRAGRWTGLARWVLLVSGLLMVFVVTPTILSGNNVARNLALIAWSLTFVPLGRAVIQSARGRT